MPVVDWRVRAFILQHIGRDNSAPPPERDTRGSRTGNGKAPRELNTHVNHVGDIVAGVASARVRLSSVNSLLLSLYTKSLLI